METRDVIALCQPCIEAAQSFSTAEWTGLGILVVIGVIGFFTKQNLFSISGAVYGFVKGRIKRRERLQ